MMVAMYRQGLDGCTRFLGQTGLGAAVTQLMVIERDDAGIIIQSAVVGRNSVNRK